MRAWSKFVAVPLVLAGGIILGLQSPAAAPEPTGPPTVSGFQLEVAGVGTLHFARCAGIGSETTSIELVDGSGPGGVQHLPDETTPLDLICMRGFSTDPELAEWRESIVAGDAQPSTATLTMFDNTLAPIESWNYYGIWPSALVVQLDGDGTPYEVVSFVASGIELQ